MEAPGIEANHPFSLENLGQHAEAGHAFESCPEAGSVDAKPSVAQQWVTPPPLVRQELPPMPSKPASGAGIEAIRKAMEAAMAAGDWGHVSELAEAMATLSATRQQGQRVQA